MGSGNGQTIGYRYSMAILMGIARGPLDEIVQIDVGDIRAWPIPDGDSESVSGLMTISEGPLGAGVAQYEDGTYATVPSDQINTIRASGDHIIKAPRLFGGDKKEGGISGLLRVFMGSATQVIPDYVKTLMGGRVPDFRGVTTMFFDGLVASMNPYPKKWQFRVRRTNSGWDGEVWQPSLAAIWMRGGTIKAMNGAHILYEAFTNRDWGRGMSRDWIDEPSWLAAAQTLHDEGIGLCLRYNRQSELSGFIQEVVSHIGGSIYPDRSTGKLALSLLRHDYVDEDLPLFDYNSGLISLGDIETAGQDDLVNEVVVKWNDPITKTERSARVQNLALNQSMGASSSTTTTYAGIPDVDAALRMCQRDLEVNSNALKRFEIVLDRRAWKLAPGMAFRISAPDRGVYNAILRAGKVTEGGSGDGRISVSATLDVFGLPSASFIAAQPSEWVPPSREAVPATSLIVREATYGELVRAIDPANLAMVPVTTGLIATVVGKPSALSQGYDLLITPDGATEGNKGSGAFAPFVVSSETLAAASGPNTISFTSPSEMSEVVVGTAVHFGNEIGRLNAIDLELGTMTIARGCFDTLPASHPAGTKFFFARDLIGTDSKEYVSGESVSVKVLPFTSTSKLAPSLALNNIVDVVARQGRPYPPARLRINGYYAYNIPDQSGDLEFTWFHRDRLLQQDQLIAQHEGSVGPELGTTYTIRVYSADVLVRTVVDLTLETWVYTTAMQIEDGIADQITVEMESVRGGIASFQKYHFTVDFI